MADASSSKQLIMEDEDLRSAFLALMRRHIPGWPATGAVDAPVYVRRAEGAENALKQIGTVWKTDRLTCLGVVVDADDQFPLRWARIREFSKANFSSVPEEPLASGLILSDNDGKRFGAWIMPDNKSSGMLETFCRPLVPTVHDSLWQYASEAASEARNKGARYIEPHVQKAHLHTFLAWHNPPGQSIGRALSSGCLDCCADGAAAFVQWARTLYDI